MGIVGLQDLARNVVRTRTPIAYSGSDSSPRYAIHGRTVGGALVAYALDRSPTSMRAEGMTRCIECKHMQVGRCSLDGEQPTAPGRWMRCGKERGV